MHPSAVRFEQWMLKNWWLHSINSINCLTSFRYVARKSYGRRSLVGCSPWGREELDSTERLHFQFSLSCIGEGNGNPLQCSRLENPRDGGAWWAALYGIAQSRTRLKRLSSSSSSMVTFRLMNKIWVRTVRMQLRLGQLRENDAVFGTGCVGISCLCITMSSLVQVSITYQILFVLSSQCMWGYFSWSCDV